MTRNSLRLGCGLFLFLLLALFLILPDLAHAQSDVPERSEIDDRFKWDLSDMYASDMSWESDVVRLEDLLAKAGTYRGRLGESGESLLEAIAYTEDVGKLVENLFVFAGLKWYEDQRVGKYSGMFSRARSLSAKASETLAFFRPELLSIPEESLWNMVESTEGLRGYRHYLESTLRMRPYTLPEEQEALLAQASDPLSKFESVFSALDNADMTFGTVLDEGGNEVELTKARYGAFLTSRNRRVRRDAWIGLFSGYEHVGNTLAANYEGHLKAKVFASQARGFDSALQARMYPDGLPVEVYTNLITTVRENAAPLQRFLRIRQRLLKVDTLQVWDLYAPFAESVYDDLDFEQAKEIVAGGLSPLGEEYVRLYYQGFDEKWADVLENRGKRGGAYSWGTYRSKPYFSMNFEGTIQDVLTLAHEYGHSLHSWFTRNTQPYAYGSYSIFVAEVASMTNEGLVLNKLLREASTPAVKLALLQEYLDRFRAAFFRQASFADFERQAHEMVEAEQPLTRESINKLYADVFNAYYGESVHTHALNDIEWSRIPHFLRTSNYYVYQYATSFAAATALSKRILDEGEPAAERFVDLLRSGNSDYPIELLKRAGVDMTTPQPVIDTITVFEQLIDELEKTLAEIESSEGASGRSD